MADNFFPDVISLLHLDTTGATVNDFPAVVGPDFDTSNGAVLTNDSDPIWGEALENTSLTNSNIKATTGWSVIPDPSGFTLDITYTPDDFADIAALWTWGDGAVPSSECLRFYVNADATLRFTWTVGGSNVINIVTSQMLTLATRHQLRLVLDGANVYIFIDGVLSIASAQTFPTFSMPSECRIGFIPFTGSAEFRRSRGDIDEFRMTNAVRSVSNYTPDTAPFPDEGTGVPNIKFSIKGPNSILDLLPILWGQVKGSLLNQTDVVDAFVASAFGALRSSTPLGFTLDATWRTIDTLDLAGYATPKFILQDTVGHGLVFQVPGEYEIKISLTVSHNELNASRYFNLRMYNDTDATGGASTRIFVARNQSGTNYSVALPFDLADADINKLITLQLQSDDAFSSVTIEGAIYMASRVSNYTSQDEAL